MRFWTALALLAPALCLAAPAPGRQTAAQPYTGLSIRDTADGPVVAWIAPGPLGGSGYASTSGVRRSDNLVSLNGRSIATAADFFAAVNALRPGDDATLVVRRSPEAEPRASVPKGGPGGEELTYTFTVADRDDWIGTIGRGLGGRAIPDPEEGEFEAMLLARAAELGALEGDEGVGGALDALMANLRTVQERSLDPNALPAVVNVFRRPLSIDAVESSLAEAARPVAADPSRAVALLRAALDVPPLPADGDPARSSALDALHAARREWIETTGLRAPARGLVAHLRQSITISGPDSGSMIRVVARAGATGENMLRWHLDRLPWLLEEVERLLSPHAAAAPLAELPEHVRAAVQGDVLHFEQRGGGGLYVVGGPGPNTYDMSVVSWVYDVGGDDVYQYRRPAEEPLVNERAVVDLGGDDLYESLDDFCGPGVGVFAIGLIDDRAGNDTYRSKEGGTQFSIAAGLFGVGVLIDHEGDDTYENVGPGSGWSMGVGFYGAGLLIDREGNDTYHGEKLVQGVGGPRGFGAIIDADGDDSYKANGPNFPSLYGTPNVYAGLSQGFGYGVRGYAAGGVGAIYDLAGNDRYEAGEFSQAGGYYFGLGILHDFAGNDEYRGNRYGQAFAAHQAAGILIDDAGDDTYWSMTAASQAGTWDQSVGMLIDRAGDDTYTADGLAQGSAAMQAIAILLDLAGNDTYSAKGDAQQGQGGNNTYHYDADKVFSFSALLDLGGGTDTYSSGRQNNTKTRTGAHNPTTPAESTLYGVFVDE